MKSSSGFGLALQRRPSLVHVLVVFLFSFSLCHGSEEAIRVFLLMHVLLIHVPDTSNTDARKSSVSTHW